MSLKDLITQAADVDPKQLAAMLDKSYRDARNAKLSYESLKSHLVTATTAPDRIATQLVDLDSRIQKELKTHENSLRQLQNLKAQWSVPIDEARQQLSTAQTKAREAAELFRTLGLVAKLQQISVNLPEAAGDEFKELLEE